MRKIRAFVFDDHTGAVCTVKPSETAPGTLSLTTQRRGVEPIAIHVNQERVKELLPLLQHFAETGELADAG